MPLYEYECKDCGFKFEALRERKEESPVPCQKCGKETDKLVSVFSHKVNGGGSNESVDMKIGREANSRWQRYTDKKDKRRKTMSEVSSSQPQTKDGKFMPVMSLGGKDEKKQRSEYTSALQEHKTKRESKGQAQFDGPGPF